MQQIKFLRPLKILCFTCILFAAQSCSAKDNYLLELYGNDADYFLALQELSENPDKAETLFKKSMKNSSSVIARKAYEQYITFGTRQDRIRRHTDYYNQYKDENSLITLCTELYNDEELSKVLKYTDSIDLTTCSNDLALLRIKALHDKNDSRYRETLLTWCLNRPFTSVHYKYYCSLPAAANEIDFRAAVYAQDYAKAASVVRSILSDDSDFKLTKYLVSDIGKALLYGSDKYSQNAWYIHSKAGVFADEYKFHAYFYAGRLFDKAGDYHALAVSSFTKAMEYSTNDSDYDNALWYLLNAKLKNSTEEAVTAAIQYKDKWHSAAYFDDFFDTLCVRLFAEHYWHTFYNFTKELDGYATDEVVAKYNYITARLIEEKFLKLDELKTSSDKDILLTKLYQRALHSGSDVYYKTVAAAKLNLSLNGFRNYFYSAEKPSCTRNYDAETLLYGYADFGFIEKIYPAWLEYNTSIGLECTKKIASFLKQCGSEENEYFTQSCRIASKKLSSIEAVPDKQTIELMFPRNFEDDVAKSCTRFELPEYLLYALIRSESFFNPIVKSNKRAMGLTQLMAPTADDIARKLKVAEYDLADASTNILFGSFYLEEMRRRCDNSNILALFSYNAGITRVRSWIKSADLEFGTSGLAKDLFLEALPYTETREYGRKLVSASALYGCLYYGKEIDEVVKEILN